MPPPFHFSFLTQPYLSYPSTSSCHHSSSIATMMATTVAVLGTRIHASFGMNLCSIETLYLPRFSITITSIYHDRLHSSPLSAIIKHVVRRPVAMCFSLHNCPSHPSPPTPESEPTRCTLPSLGFLALHLSPSRVECAYAPFKIYLVSAQSPFTPLTLGFIAGNQTSASSIRSSSYAPRSHFPSSERVSNSKYKRSEILPEELLTLR
jgi:hypothetical protein